MYSRIPPHSMLSTTTTANSIPDVPPPWHLKGDCYWMLLKPLKTLPPAAHAPLEEPAIDGPTNKFLGGLGTVWVVRYETSPVGPYDELIYVPGNFASPSGEPRPRITRIYVSTAVSAYNGRKNWNVPKHLARFAFTSLEGGSIRIEVSDYYADDARPFFAAVMKPQRFLPYLPFSTRWIRDASGPIPLPPLPPGPPDHPEEAGTSDWTSFAMDVRGSVRICWWEPAPPRDTWTIPAGEYTDGRGFPKLDVRSFGIEFTPGKTTVEFSKRYPVEGA